MNYQEALDFLYSQLPMYQRVGAKAFKKDLTNTLQLVDFLGDPQEKFASVHIAGTNGKGSTAHMIASVLQEAGYRVGLYTSPHLKSFRERIRVNGELIADKFVPEFVERVRRLIDEIQPSFFELTVAMAFDYFAAQNVDIAVIETGLGGRLDSTNVITPEVSVITSIGLDHQDMLGNTIEQISREKGGIIKDGIPVVVGKLPPEALREIEGIAKEKKSKFVTASETIRFDGIESSLSGKSLTANIETVFETIQIINDSGYDIQESAFQVGIKNVVQNTGLKGRWQVLKEKPLVICDVGHNEEAILEITRQIDKTPYANLHVVLGMVKEKSIDSVLALLHTNAKYYFCAAKVPRAMPVDELSAIASKHGLMGQSFDSVTKAYRQALTDADTEDLVFVGGSTFVVAEIDDL